MVDNSRDLALKKINEGINRYNAESEFLRKNAGYLLFISGIEDLNAYKKREENPEIVKMVSQKIVTCLNDAKGMKSYLDSIKPVESPPKVNTSQQINNKNPQQSKDNLENNNGKSQIKDKGNDEKDKEKDKFEEMLNETILGTKPNVKWDDIAGLENAKKALQEAVILPIKFPQIFTGTRTPWKGILFYGPPGTGKSYLAKACATECDATFFNISAADLISKWVGESEKLIKTLFKMAREKKPSIIFIDEVDSMTGNREGGGGGGNDSSSRIKTQFLIEMQGVGHDDVGVLVLGATNIPWGLDPAIRRRFEKRIYIALPEQHARKQLLQNLLKSNRHTLVEDDIDYIASQTEGYSGADMSILIRDASYEPLRKCERATKFKRLQINGKTAYTPCSPSDPQGIPMTFQTLKGDELYLPDISMDDFITVLGKIKPSVCEADILKQVEFTTQFGQDG